ncbi:type I-E CRISPR-associated protein Cas5/CasD [Micrococcales bacterium 31B]|nr:type I-E CRISPR-associated protein Cas5/CasD [Micrococcales bacterium 31B]
MKTLILLLAGPMQSWGSRSRFTRRETEEMPTKSGIIGLLAAAKGMRRSDPIEELTGIRLAVREEQRGRLERDFQTAINRDGKSMPLTDRFYLADARFTAYVESENDELIEGLSEALIRPTFPLYLGRRAFAPSAPVLLRAQQGGAMEAARSEPWRASTWHKNLWRYRARPHVELRVQADADVLGIHGPTRVLDDFPLSFNMEHRRYRARAVAEEYVEVTNDALVQPQVSDSHESTAGGPNGGHDPMSSL